MEFSEYEHKVLTAIRNAVLDKGEDYVYVAPTGAPRDGLNSSCFYLDYAKSRPTGKASCLIGHGLLYSGEWSVDDLAWVEGRAAELILDGSDVFNRALDHMQAQQDNDEPWGAAYNAGLETLADAGYDVSQFVLDSLVSV